MSPGVPALRTTVERTARSALVCADGELDLATADLLRQALAQAGAARPVQLVVDVSGVRFVDATGLAPLLQAARSTRAAGGDLRLAGPSRMLRRMLRLLELEDDLPVSGP